MDYSENEPLNNHPLWNPIFAPAPALMRTRHAALAAEKIDHLSFYILAVILAFDLPTQAQVARRLNLRYWTLRNHADCSPWIIKQRLDLIRLSVTPEALAMMHRIKPAFIPPPTSTPVTIEGTPPKRLRKRKPRP
jgi:hypothetical protein